MKIKVEHLANIKSAEIEIKPLTVFLGKNNTNKSYLSYVVYGVYRYMAEVLMEFLKGQDAGKLELDKIDVKHPDLVKILQERIEKMFRSESFSSFKLDIEFSEEESEMINKIIDNMLVIRKQEGNDKSLSMALIRSFLELINTWVDVFYFPASRTGFVLALDALVIGVLRERYEGKYYEKLTEPVVDFIADFYRIKSQSEDLRGLSREKELLRKLSDMIDGEIWIDKNTKQLLYHSKGIRGQKKIEMHLVSSSIAELAPIYVFLANIEKLENHIFIIEEPEAHLHVENQIKITELIVSMVNSGAKVLITTHSDYIINALNICLGRYWVGDYEKESLDPNKIAVYLFKEEGRRIKVLPVPIEEYEGIPFENFYTATDRLMEEEERIRDLLKKKNKVKANV